MANANKAKTLVVRPLLGVECCQLFTLARKTQGVDDNVSLISFDFVNKIIITLRYFV